MKHPYSTTHYHCGCHIVENEPSKVNLEESIYCEDRRIDLYTREVTGQTVSCLYLQVLRLRRVQAARQVC